MDADAVERAAALQRPLPDEMMRVVMTGEREDRHDGPGVPELQLRQLGML